MFNVIQKVKNPVSVVLTPLRTTDTIHKDLKKSLKRNNILFDWVSYSSDANCPQNANFAWENYIKTFNFYPETLIKLDNDIEPEYHFLDKLYYVLKNSSEKIGYSYCSFEMYGVKNLKFPVKKFSVKELLIQNYISSNSLIKMNAFLSVGGFNCNKEYERLCDWVCWLKLLEKGYEGIPCLNTFFKTELKQDSISNRSVEDYYSKYRKILKEIVEPLRTKIGV